MSASKLPMLDSAVCNFPQSGGACRIFIGKDSSQETFHYHRIFNNKFMEYISKALFWLANSMLIPDIILLLLLFGRSVLLIGGFYNQFMTKRKNDKLFAGRIREFSASQMDELRGLLPESDNSLFVVYLRDLLSSPPGEAYGDYLLSCFENRAEKDLALSRVLSKLGPILGLMGTLIAMSPALVGLSQGDIGGMAYNMQIVFSTTVVGLIISAIGIITLQAKQRWYAADLNKLEYVADVLLQRKEEQLRDAVGLNEVRYMTRVHQQEKEQRNVADLNTLEFVARAHQQVREEQR